ncbi:FecR domain-containing protein [Parabacteroides sp. OttesenSCG-928-G06]|nr:FecR domain-containing protein [Parabacteroides sp. OttesenSCG-928-G06]
MEEKDKNMRFVVRRYREKSLDAEAAWDDFSRRQGIRRVALLRKYWVGAAAVLLLLIGIGGRYWLDRTEEEWVTIAAGSEVMKQVWLPDSSLVTLAANSEVSYDRKQYGKERRRVMMNGKAFFEVQPDGERPFSVHTERTTTTVLGTSFQLVEKEQETHLFVNTGKVSFEADNGKEILTAGMQATYDKEKGMQRMEEPTPVNHLAWKTRELRFRNTPVKEVLRDINEVYQTSIALPAGIEALELTAYFDHQPIDEVVAIINETLGIELTVPPTQ